MCRSRSWAPATRCCRPSRCSGSAAVRWCCCRGMFRCLRAATRSSALVRTARGTVGGRDRAHRARAIRPTVTGAIVRRDGEIAAIVEHKDASPAERGDPRDQQRRLCVRHRAAVCGARARLDPSNAQGEYYLPDLVRIYRARGLTVETVRLDDPREILGVNSRKELADVAAILKIAEERRADGRRRDARRSRPRAYIGPDVTDRRRHDRPSGRLSRRHDADRLPVRNPLRRAHRELLGRRRGDHQQLLRDHRLAHRQRRRGRTVRAPAAAVATSASTRKIGNFVELKKTVARARLQGQPPVVSGRRDDRREGQHRRRHDHVQLRRHRRSIPTIIEDGAFIGSDSQLIAPVRVGKGAYVGGGLVHHGRRAGRIARRSAAASR